MIAEVLFLLAGHPSSLFPTDHKVHPSFSPLLHPGEQQCLESLAQIAFRYRKVRESNSKLSRSPSRYVCALCATLHQILRDEYESLVVETEAMILKKDATFVASGSFVPLSSLQATFADWSGPLAALSTLMDDLEELDWKPGPLIDMLMARSHTGVHRVANIFSRLSSVVQRAWRTQLVAFVVHGTLPDSDPLASETYVLLDGSTPSCVSAQSRDSIAYVGRAVATVKAAKWQYQIPKSLATEHTGLLNSVLPEDQHEFDRVVAQIRTNVSEWLWSNVLTQKDVEVAVDSLANYFLLRNGEFSLSLIQEIERLKISRLTSRSGSITMIREQDLNLALLRASLNTAAQYDSSLALLRFILPSGPLRPLLPALTSSHAKKLSNSATSPFEQTTFDDLLLGTPLCLTYKVSWPLDLFLYPSDLQIYAALFGYLSSLRKTHTRIHSCWTSLSNAQRARRKWTGLGEGGTSEDYLERMRLLRCGWGVVRDMGWFLDTLMGYVMTDVIDSEFRRLKNQLGQSRYGNDQLSSSAGGSTEQGGGQRIVSGSGGKDVKAKGGLTPSGSWTATTNQRLDFTTLRNIHSVYLERLLTGCLLSNPALTATLRPILEVCERFVAQVERWGGDVLPALLFEGSLSAGGNDRVGDMVRERWEIVAEINETLRVSLGSFYEQLSLSTTQQPFSAAADASKSIMMNISMANASSFHHTFVRPKGAKGLEVDGEVRRHVERLLLRLDFNGRFSTQKVPVQTDILKEGGLG